MPEPTESKSRASRWQLLLMSLAMAVLAGGVGLLLGDLGKSSVPTRFVTRLDALNAWDLLALPLLMVGVLAFHEAGHLAGGMSRGMRFLLFIAGPFAWLRGEKGIHFRWMFNLSTFGGLAAALPVPDRPLKPQLMRLVLGGPLASLLLAAVALAASMEMTGRVGAYALIVAGMSLAIFVVTALPLRNGGFMSDGMQLLQLRRNPAMVERRVRLLALMGHSMGGTRPRDYDSRLLQQAQALTGDESVYDIGVWLYGYFHAFDSGDTAAAALWLDRIELAYADYPDGFRQSLAIELALYEALVRRRLDVAKAWLSQGKGGMVDASRRHLAEAAVARLQGQDEAALVGLNHAQRKLGESMDAGTAMFSAEQIARLRREISRPGD